MRLWKEVLGVELPRPFLRMPFDESMASYGNDKPDLRFGMEHVVLTELVRQHGGGGVPLLDEAVEGGRHRQGAAGPGQRRLLAHRDRQARGVRQGHGRQGAWPAPRWARTASGPSPRSPRPSPPSCAWRSTPAIGAAAGRPAPLPVRQGVAGAHGDGQPARAPGQEDGAHPRVRLGRPVALPLGGRPAALRVRRGDEAPGPPRTTPSPGPTTRTCSTSRPTRGR